MPVRYPKLKRLQRGSLRITCHPDEPISPSSIDVEFEKALKRVLQSEMRQMACEHCQGCEVDHPSQTRHFHLMAGPEELVILYFEDAFNKILEGGDCMERVWDEMKGSWPKSEEDLHRLKYCSKDSFTTLVGKLKHKVEENLKYDYTW
jgi:hypothetical protein